MIWQSLAGKGETSMSSIKKWERSKVATNLIYQAINDLRAELAILDSTIEQVEALAEDPPRRVRPRKSEINRPLRAASNGHNK
jgi:hypothetical protein